MADEKKTMLKNKLIVCKKAGAILTIVGFLTFTTASAATIAYGANAVSDYKELGNKVSEIKCSESYQDYRIEEQRRLYNEYKAGKLSANEFNDAIDNLNTNDHVLDNIELFTSDEEQNEITEMQEEYEEVSDISSNIAIYGVGGGMLGFLTGLIAGNIIREKENNIDKEMDIEL